MAKIAKDPVRFVPPDQEEKPEGEQIAYWIQPPGKWEKLQFERELGARGAVSPGYLVYLSRLREGIEDLLESSQDEEKKADLLSEIDAAEELARENLIELHRLIQDAGSRLYKISAQVRRGYAPFAECESDLRFYLEANRLLAVQRFVMRWEGLSQPCERSSEGLTAGSLEAIPDDHIFWVGIRAQDLMTVTEQEAKNSGSPLHTGSTKKSSSGATAKGTRKKTRKKTPGTSKK